MSDSLVQIYNHLMMTLREIMRIFFLSDSLKIICHLYFYAEKINGVVDH